MPLVTIATTQDLAPGEGRPLDVEGTPLALFNVGGTFHCIDSTCCHRGGPLGDGELSGTSVTCPWHGWQYDVTTGKCLAPDPAASVKSYPVTIEGDEVKIDLG